MMIEKVMIQLGVYFNRKGGGGGHQRGTCDAEDAGQKPTGKAEDAKSQSQKAAKSHKAKKASGKLAMQRMRKRGTVNAEDAKRKATQATKTHVKATKAKKPKSHPP